VEDTAFVRVRHCGSGRVHVQIGFMTLCLEPEQLAELVDKARQALDRSACLERLPARWPTGMPQ
jgi:hypothetical protein